MPLTPDQIKAAIEASFPKADTTGIEGTGGRVYGEFVWSGFKGQTIPQRLEIFRTRVRDPLGVQGVDLGTVVPLAPGEHAL
jgi:hypothetical protein